jgi:hypothetical protein
MSTQEIPTQQPSPDAQRGPGGPGMLEPDGLGSSPPAARRPPAVGRVETRRGGAARVRRPVAPPADSKSA